MTLGHARQRPTRPRRDHGKAVVTSGAAPVRDLVSRELHTPLATLEAGIALLQQGELDRLMREMTFVSLRRALSRLMVVSAAAESAADALDPGDDDAESARR